MGNISENKLNVVIAAADITIINNSISAIATKIPAGSLTPEQRASFLGMDVDNKIFVEDCINQIGISGAGIIPAFILPANLQNDLTGFEQMDVIEAALANLQQKVSDVKRIYADEAMTAANAVYKMFEMAAIAGVPNAQRAYEILKARYASQGPVKKDNP
jgi:hypothetical protein